MEEKGVRTADTRNLRSIIFFVFIIIVMAIVILLQGKDSFLNLSNKPRVKPGLPAPNFTFPGLDGKMVSLTDFKG